VKLGVNSKALYLYDDPKTGHTLPALLKEKSNIKTFSPTKGFSNCGNCKVCSIKEL